MPFNKESQTKPKMASFTFDMVSNVFFMSSFDMSFNKESQTKLNKSAILYIHNQHICNRLVLLKKKKKKKYIFLQLIFAA